MRYITPWDSSRLILLSHIFSNNYFHSSIPMPFTRASSRSSFKSRVLVPEIPSASYHRILTILMRGITKDSMAKPSERETRTVMSVSKWPGTSSSWQTTVPIPGSMLAFAASYSPFASRLSGLLSLHAFGASISHASPRLSNAVSATTSKEIGLMAFIE